MTDSIIRRNGVVVLLCGEDGPALADHQDAADLVGQALGGGADLIVVPVARLDGRFFDLRSGLAGAVAQKFVNYRIRLAVVGDIAPHLAASSALRDFVREANRGRQLWFVADLAELDARLAG